MKVNVDQTEQVSDEQRNQIAVVLDQKVSRRQATRQEMKDYLWNHGSQWPSILADSVVDLLGNDDASDSDFGSVEADAKGVEPEEEYDLDDIL